MKSFPIMSKPFAFFTMLSVMLVNVDAIELILHPGFTSDVNLDSSIIPQT